MSFWEDATGITKAVVGLGVVGLIYFAIAFAAGLPPFGAGEELAQERGLPAPDSAEATTTAD